MDDNYLLDMIEQITQQTKKKLADLGKLYDILKNSKNEEQQYYLLVPRQVFVFKIGCLEEVEEHKINFGEISKFLKSYFIRKIKKHQKTYKRLRQKLETQALSNEQQVKLEFSSLFADAKIQNITYTSSKILCELNKPIIVNKKIWRFLDKYYIYQVY